MNTSLRLSPTHEHALSDRMQLILVRSNLIAQVLGNVFILIVAFVLMHLGTTSDRYVLCATTMFVAMESSSAFMLCRQKFGNKGSRITCMQAAWRLGCVFAGYFYIASTDFTTVVLYVAPCFSRILSTHKVN